MDETTQVHLPPSFVALFVPAGKTKPVATLVHIAQRYELCEDMAQLLCESASEQQFKTGAAPHSLVEAMEAALLGDGAVLEPGEAHWVVVRMAELLHWELPPVPGSDA